MLVSWHLMASCICVFMLQHTAPQCSASPAHRSTYSTLQRTAAHWSPLQPTAAHCSTLQHTAAHCSTLPHTLKTLGEGLVSKENGCCLLVRCICNNMLHHTATACCSTLQHTEYSRGGLEQNSPYSTLCLQQHAVRHCNSIAATNCNTLQRAEDSRRGSRREWLLYWLLGKPVNESWHTYERVMSPFKFRNHNTLPLTATHCNALHHTVTHCNTMQYTATHCNTLHVTIQVSKLNFNSCERMAELCHTCEWIMSHEWMSHVTGADESCHTYHWVMSHISMSHVTHINVSCHTYQCVMSHTSMCHV